MTEEHEQMIEDCIARQDRMSAWECNFIDSAADWLSRGGKTLTERQAAILDRIWERVTEKG